MNLICYAQEKYFVCTRKRIRVHSKKNFTAYLEKFYCLPKENLLHAHVVIPTYPFRKNLYFLVK